MILKIISGILIAIAVFMGVKQGLAMMTGKLEMLEMFGKWNFSRNAITILGAVTLLSGVLIAIPKTFLWGNFLMAATILLIICFHLLDKDLKGVAIEVPFLLLNLAIIYLGHPLANKSL